MSLSSATVTLFLVFAPLGMIPAFLSMLSRVAEHRRRWVIVREHLIALLVLIGSLLGGPAFLRLLGVEQDALRMGGGIVLFLIAVRMIFPKPEGVFGDGGIDGEPLVVPLAIPLLAGPSSTATVMLFGTQEPDQIGKWLLAILFAWLGSLAVVLVSDRLRRVLGDRGLVAAERLMGMVLVVVASQMFGTGLRAFIRS